MMSLKDNVLRIILSFSLLLFAVACQEVYSQDLVLFDFEEDSELDRFQWSCRTLSELADQHAAHGARSLKVDMYPAVYPGVTAKLDNHDWRGYKALQIDIFNPQNKEVRLTVRIDDRRKYPPDGDSYNNSYTIPPGATKLRILLDGLRTSHSERMIELKNIHRIIVFTSNPETKTTLYFDYIRLTREL